MGNISTGTNNNNITLILQQNDEQNSNDNGNSNILKLNVNLHSQINNNIKQLLNWSLEQIRQNYAPFRKRKSSPLLTRCQFLRFIRLSRITSSFIYDCICKLGLINIFQLMCMLILTSYTTYYYKIQFLFNVFDLLGNHVLQFSELILMFESLIRGYCRLTQQNLPNIIQLQKYAQVMFARADLNNDQNLQLSQIIAWFENNNQGMQLFNRFQPSFYGKEEFYIFNSFVSYHSIQLQALFKRIKKVYRKDKIDEKDYTLLSNQVKQKIKQKKQFKNQQNKSKIKNYKNIKQKQNINNFQIEKSQKSKLPLLNENNNNNIFKNQNKKNHNNHIIITRGKSLTKKQIFHLRQYFDKISNGKKYISIQDFLQSFNQQKYSHMKSIAASLYNFLDKKQNGHVTFIELVLKLYPSLTITHIKQINNWSKEYNSYFKLEKKIKIVGESQDLKKRILPKNCILRFKEIFNFFDQENKGFLTFEDLKKILHSVISENQLKLIFDSNNKNLDGKLTIQQFVHVMLPQDLEIQGLY